MKKSVVILLHIGYWALYWVLVSFVILATFQGMKHVPLNTFFFSPIAVLSILPAVLAFYGSYIFLFENFLNRKKIFRLVTGCILTALISSFLSCIALSVIFGGRILFNDGYTSASGIAFIMTIIAGIHSTISLVMKGFINWYGDIKLKADLIRKNYETELALLKSRINPHFLFNTINNIDVLISKDAMRASAYLNKLSDIMRFMLYETKSEKIPLSKELSYIEKFIELQKIRTTNQHYVNYNVNGDSSTMQIPPMLFISFIENAFKHTENKKTENAININLDIEKEKIVFKCENSFSTNLHHEKIDGNGMGNDLIKKRLSLLYPDKHTLSISNNNDLYKVALTLY